MVEPDHRRQYNTGHKDAICVPEQLRIEYKHSEYIILIAFPWQLWLR
jgi:hypothetical protein